MWYGLRLRTTANPRTVTDDGALHLTVSQIRRSARQSAIVVRVFTDDKRITRQHKTALLSLIFVEADPMNNRISNESPVGRGILGHKAGEIVDSKRIFINSFLSPFTSFAIDIIIS